MRKASVFSGSKPPAVMIALVSLVVLPTWAQESIRSQIAAIQQSLEREVSCIQPETLQKIERGLRWAEAFETVQSNLVQGRTDGVVRWILLWNDFDSTGPSSLSAEPAKRLRGRVSLLANSPRQLRKELGRVKDLTPELLLEIQALDRIERHRRRDLVVTVRDPEGNAVRQAQVDVHQVTSDFLFGCNIYNWRDEDTELQRLYRRRFAHLMNYATLGFYWASFERREGETRTAHWQKVAEWCSEHGVKAKGHPLAWNTSDPEWLPDDPDQVFRLQLERTEREVKQFAGLIDCWDVVNEVVMYDRESFEKRSPKLTAAWRKYGQFEFARQCFLAARKCNPGATLLINDYELRTREKATEAVRDTGKPPVVYEDVIQALVDDNGKPLFDAIGIQSHMHTNVWPTERIVDVVKRFGKYGVPLHFTETTMVSGPGKEENWRETSLEGEILQADEVERFYRTVFSCPEVEALTWWDLSDYRSWQGAPAGLIRKDMSPKPAYQRLKRLVLREWRTYEKGTTDSQGEARFRAYHGRYLIGVKAPNGMTAQEGIDLPEGRGPLEMEVVVKKPRSSQ